MRVRIDNIAMAIDASRSPDVAELQRQVDAGGSPSAVGNRRVQPNAPGQTGADAESRTDAGLESPAVDAQIGRALELRLNGAVLTLSRAAVNAQAQAGDNQGPRLHTIVEEIHGLAARAASGTLTDRERVTMERRIHLLERELDVLSSAQRASAQNAWQAPAQPGPSTSPALPPAAAAILSDPTGALVAQANAQPSSVLRRLA
jgi:hypothetical protein